MLPLLMALLWRHSDIEGNPVRAQTPVVAAKKPTPFVARSLPSSWTPLPPDSWAAKAANAFAKQPLPPDWTPKPKPKPQAKPKPAPKPASVSASPVVGSSLPAAAPTELGIPPARPASPKPQQPPPLYTLKDTSGQAWTHAEPAVLRDWVARRNAEMRRVIAPEWFAAPVVPGCVGFT